MGVDTDLLTSTMARTWRLLFPVWMQACQSNMYKGTHLACSTTNLQFIWSLSGKVTLDKELIKKKHILNQKSKRSIVTLKIEPDIKLICSIMLL